MSMRAKVFDEWVLSILKPNSTIIHIGCGLDSRIVRTNITNNKWFDVDFEQVINLRIEYFILI